MNRKILFIIAGIAVASVTVAAVTAIPLTYNTPLYTVRMEQISSEMNFLPTEMNDFTFTAENGYNLNYIPEYCDVGSYDTYARTYDGSYTCWGYYTCPFTCNSNITCYSTCRPTACAPCPYGFPEN
jgi:hypothetical protein